MGKAGFEIIKSLCPRIHRLDNNKEKDLLDLSSPLGLSVSELPCLIENFRCTFKPRCRRLNIPNLTLPNPLDLAYNCLPHSIAAAPNSGSL